MKKAAIFDIDGTLLDSVDLHATAWQRAFEHYGHQFPLAKIRGQIGKGGDQLMPVFLSEKELKEKGDDIEKYRSALFKSKFLPLVKPFAGVRALFEQLLQDEWKLALASSAKGDELETYKEICKITDLVDTETSSDDAKESKPHPDIFQAALKRLGSISPAHCIAIGDTPYDAEAAGKTGIATIGVLCGGFHEDELRKAGCREIYAEPASLLEQYKSSLFNSL